MFVVDVGVGTAVAIVAAVVIMYMTVAVDESVAAEVVDDVVTPALRIRIEPQPKSKHT